MCKGEGLFLALKLTQLRCALGLLLKVLDKVWEHPQ